MCTTSYVAAAFISTRANHLDTLASLALCMLLLPTIQNSITEIWAFPWYQNTHPCFTTGKMLFIFFIIVIFFFTKTCWHWRTAIVFQLHITRGSTKKSSQADRAHFCRTTRHASPKLEATTWGNSRPELFIRTIIKYGKKGIVVLWTSQWSVTTKPIVTTSGVNLFTSKTATRSICKRIIKITLSRTITRFIAGTPTFCITRSPFTTPNDARACIITFYIFSTHIFRTGLSRGSRGSLL